MEKFEVVISGISGRFPDCDTVPEFETKLYAGKYFVSENADRWPLNYRYKFSENVLPSATGKFRAATGFDPAVFYVNHAVAECTDVLNRKIMEPCFECVMDAGINPYDLSGRNVAVLTAYDHSDGDANSTEERREGRLWVLGSSKTMMSNRISFALNLSGPSFAYTSDMFGNLTALNEAYKSISEGRVEAAIVGVVSTVLHPMVAVNLQQMNVLSQDSITRVFDKNATGYGRSDGLVCLFLQRADEAKRIYASIDFTGSTYFGSNPNSYYDFDEDLLKSSVAELYKQDNYHNIDDVSFVEMSACGLKKHDKTESNFIAETFCKNKQTPLLVGSVKSNVGVADATGPYLGVLKALLAFNCGYIVPNLHINEVDDRIRAFVEKKLQIVTKSTNLTGDKVAVNSIGIVGCLSQVILKRNTRVHKLSKPASDPFPRIILACSRTEDGVIDVLKKLELTDFNAEFISMVNDVFCNDMPFHLHRGYSILSRDRSEPKINATAVKGNKNRPVWFLFSGMGSQWNGMGEGLLQLPIIAETVKKCDQVLKKVGVDIYHILTTDDPTIFDNIMHSFVGIITIQIALVQVLKALGIKPDGIIGHSVGENACAYADGCLTLEQAVLSSYARGMASIETKTIKGMMAAVGKGYNEIKDVLPKSIEVACHNSATSCTLSGPSEDVEKYVQELQSQKVFAKAVNVANIAYHSKYIAPAAPNLLARLQQVIPEPVKRSPMWISTSIPESDWHTPLAKYCSAEYLTNNLLNCVMFEEGCKHVPSDALVIEVAPHGLLQAIVKRSLAETCANVSLTKRNADGKNLQNLLSAIGELYLCGLNVNVNALYPSIEYPVSRQTPSISQFARWQHSDLEVGMNTFDLVGSRSGDAITIRVNDDSPYSYLRDHKINDRIILTTSFFLNLVWHVYSILRNKKLDSNAIVFEDIKLLKNVTISSSNSRTFSVCIQKGTGRFEVLKFSSKSNSKDKLVVIMTGIIYLPDESFNHVVDESGLKNIKYHVSSEQFYSFFKSTGYQLQGSFCGLQELKYNERDSYAKLKWCNNWTSFLDSIFKFSMFSQMKNETDLLYTYKIRRIEIAPGEISSLESGTTLLCHNQSSTGLISCNGLRMYSVKNKHLSLSKNRSTNVKLQALRFIPYSNPRCQNVAEFCNFCLQIAIDNVRIMPETCNAAKLSIIMGENTTYANLLKHIVKGCDTLKNKISFRLPKDVLANKYASMDECYMLLSNNFDDFLKSNVNYAFVLIAISKDDSVPVEVGDNFVLVTKQKFSDTELYFFKKKSGLYEKSDSSFVVKHTTDSADLSLMLNDCREPSDPRYMFVMDKEELSDSILKIQQIRDLPVSVLQNGEWGSYQNTFDCQPELNGNAPEDILLESVHLHYVSCDKKIELQDNKAYNYGIEFSGVQASGERVMGIASVNTNDPVSKPDTILKWNVPNNWSLEDAVTVPLAYAKAFHILDAPVIRGKQYVDSVLINVGDEGAFCEACIAISLSRGNEVYVTVSSSDQAAQLKKKFPQLDDSRIFNSRECSFECEVLKMTKGEGVSVVVNCLPGSKSVNGSLNSLTNFAYLIQVGKADDWENQQLELYPFLKSISCVLVRNDVSSLMKLPIEEKENLKALVEEGIKAGIVVPFDRNVQIQGMPENDLNDENGHVKNIFKWFPSNETSLYANQKIRYDSTHSYVVIGEKKNASWFELVEWLISKGARKIIAVVDNFAFGPNISHRMSRLLSQKNVTIVPSSSQKIETLQDADRLVQEANNIAPLEAVFFVSTTLAGNRIANVDLATRKLDSNIHFVSIFSGGLKEFESRRFAGLPAIVIHGQDPNSYRKLTAILPQVDEILSRFDNNNSPTLYRFISAESEAYEPTLRNYFPRDTSTLKKIGDDLSSGPAFVEVTTKTPRFCHLKDSSPVFIISVVGPRPMQGLISNLMSPTFCCSIGHSTDLAAELARKLYKSINVIESKRGVTLVSETWSTPVAFEIIKLLERDGRKFKLFTLDGNPVTWKQRIAKLGPLGSVQFENNLIAHVLNIDPEVRLEGIFGPDKSLPEKLEDYLSSCNYLPMNVSKLAAMIHSIRRGLEMISKYEYDNQLLKNTVLMERNFDKNYSLNLSVSSELFVSEAQDYFKFIASSEVYDKINSDVVYTLWCN